MRNAHFPLLALAGALVLSSHTCNPQGTGLHPDLSALAPGKWLLEKLDGSATAGPAENRPYLVLDSTGAQVHGFAGCNRFFGPVHVHGDSISFADLASTRMYCEQTQKLEDQFLDALRTARTFTLGNGQLVLSNGKELAVFRKVDDDGRP